MPEGGIVSRRFEILLIFDVSQRLVLLGAEVACTDIMNIRLGIEIFGIG